MSSLYNSITGLWLEARPAEQASTYQVVDKALSLELQAKYEPGSGVASIQGSWVPNDPLYSSQWGLSNIQVDDAWDLNQGGRSDITISVIDTGLTHGLADFNTTSINWDGAYDFTQNDTDPADGHGHGTHVSGTIAQSTNNGYGVAGVAFNTTVLPIKALSDSGSGTYTWIANAIDHAVAQGADVINMSLGGSSYSSTLEAACRRAYEAGVLVVCAAGNDGLGSLSYPAAFSTTLAVGATDSNNNLAYFSNHTSDIVVAPGVSIKQQINTGAFSSWSGTSMASPHVAGVAGLILSEALDLHLDIAGVMPEKSAARVDWITNILINTADDLGAVGQDSTFGHGKINAYAALDYLQSLAVDPPPGGDDYGQDTSTNGRIMVGGAASGDLEAEGDQDWFRITLRQGAEYRFDLQGADSGQGTLADPRLTLYDAAGAALASDDNSGQGSDASLTHVAGASGYFYLGAASAQELTGDYKLSAVMTDDYGEGLDLHGSLELGTPVTGKIEAEGDTDWFQVSLAAGTRYQFDLAGASSGQGTLADPYLNLRDADGLVVASDDNSGEGNNARIELVAQSGGIYYLDAAGAGGGTGTYTLKGVSDDYAGDTSTTGQMQVGSSISGNLETQGDRDWFAIDLTAGGIYNFDLEGAYTNGGSLVDPYLRLYNSQGAQIAYNDDGGEALNSRITYTAAYDGRYYLGAGGYADNEVGTYRLSASEQAPYPDDYAADPSTQGLVAMGGSSTGELEVTGDHDWFRVTLSEGYLYEFNLQGMASGAGTLEDPYLRLYDEAGNQVAFDDDGGEGWESRINFQAQAGGVYFLDAGGYDDLQTGTYRISAFGDDFSADSETRGEVAVDGVAAGEIERQDDHDWFAVELAAGQTYVFDLKGQATDDGTLGNPNLTLRDSLGNALASNDNGGEGLNSQVVFTASEAGTYYLDASGYGFSHRQRIVTGRGRRRRVTYRDVYTNTTGTYQLAAEADDYRQDADTTGSLVLGGSVNGDIQFKGDKDWIAVELTAGTVYGFDLTGLAEGDALANPNLAIYDAAGNKLASNDNGGEGLNSHLQFVAATDGTYYLEASGYGLDHRQRIVTGRGRRRKVTYRDIYSDTTGEYVLSGDALEDDYTQAANTEGLAVVNGSTSGDIQFQGDKDWFKVELAAGETYIFDLQGSATGDGTLANPNLAMYDAEGNKLGSDDNGGTGHNSKFVFTANEAGTYYLEASGYGLDYRQRIVTGRGRRQKVTYRDIYSDTVGTYQLTTETDDYHQDISTTGAVTVNGSAFGDIQFQGDKDWFRVELAAGETYIFDLEGSATGDGTLANPNLALYDAEGNRLTGDDNSGTGHNAKFVFTAEQAGTYYLETSGYGVDYTQRIVTGRGRRQKVTYRDIFSNTTGTYRVSAQTDDFTQDITTSGTVAIGGSIDGDIQFQGDKDWIAVELTAGAAYNFELVGRDGDGDPLANPNLALYDAEGNKLAANDNGGDGLNAYLSYTAAASGTYYLEASGYGLHHRQRIVTGRGRRRKVTYRNVYSDTIGDFTLLASAENSFADVLDSSLAQVQSELGLGEWFETAAQDLLRSEYEAGRSWVGFATGVYQGSESVIIEADQTMTIDPGNGMMVYFDLGDLTGMTTEGAGGYDGNPNGRVTIHLAVGEGAFDLGLDSPVNGGMMWTDTDDPSGDLQMPAGVGSPPYFGFNWSAGDLSLTTFGPGESPSLGDLSGTTISFELDMATVETLFSLPAENIDQLLSDIAQRITAEGGLTSFTASDGDVLIGSEAGDELTGRAGSDTLAGLGGDDLLDGGRGDDLLQGGTGDDTYRFYRDGGSDVIDEAGSASAADVLEIHERAGWNLADFDNMANALDSPEDLLVYRDGNDLVIDLAVQGAFGTDEDEGTIRIKDMGLSDSMVETLRLMDGEGNQIGGDIDLAQVWDSASDTPQTLDQVAGGTAAGAATEETDKTKDDASAMAAGDQPSESIVPPPEEQAAAGMLAA